MNPDDGPIQAFAHDLRRLREAAGNPTYRELAKIAGYSASTLSEAAGGVRLPGLEVTLAYVGACKADAAQWSTRWHQVSRQISRRSEDLDDGAATAASSPASPASSAQLAAAVPVDLPAALAPSEGSLPNLDDDAEISQIVQGLGGHEGERLGLRRCLAQHSMLVRSAILVLTVGLLGWWLMTVKQVRTDPTAARADVSAVDKCPTYAPNPNGSSTFTGVTYEVATHLRAGAGLSSTVLGQIPAGCTLEFTGYCLGDVVQSAYSGSPDMRWFEVEGGGLVASAVIHGDPPQGMPPGSCPQDMPPPVAVSLALAPGGSATGARPIGLEASGTHVWIVGFAAYYPAASGESAQWHQLAMTAASAPYFTANLLVGAGSGFAGLGPIPVVADACLGGDAPTAAVAVEAIRPGAPPSLQPFTLSATAMAQGEQSACGYPTVQ